MTADSTADILAAWLIAVGLATDPVANPGHPWPVYATYLPADGTDDAIGLIDTTGTDEGRTMRTPAGGAWRLEHYGVQFRIRATDHAAGFAQAVALAAACDSLANYKATLGNANSYVIAAITRKGPVMPVGPEQGRPGRMFFTFNVTVSIQE